MAFSFPLIAILFQTLAFAQIENLDQTKAPEGTIIFAIEDRSPFSFMDEIGNGKGLLPEAAKKRALSANVPYKFELLPFNRHVAMIQDNKVKICSVGRFKNPEREKMGLFNAKPIYKDKGFVFVFNAKNPITKNKTVKASELKAIFANETLRLYTKQNYSYGKNLDDLLKNSKNRRNDSVKEHSEVFRNLEQGFADFTLSTVEEFDDLASDQKKLLRSAFIKDIPGEARYFFCSKLVGEDTLKKLDSK